MSLNSTGVCGVTYSSPTAPRGLFIRREAFHRNTISLGHRSRSSPGLSLSVSV